MTSDECLSVPATCDINTRESTSSMFMLTKSRLFSINADDPGGPWILSCHSTCREQKENNMSRNFLSGKNPKRKPVCNPTNSGDCYAICLSCVCACVDVCFFVFPFRAMIPVLSARNRPSLVPWAMDSMITIPKWYRNIAQTAEGFGPC